MSFAFRSQRGSFEIPQEEVRQTRRFNVYIPRKENPGPGSYDVPAAFDKRNDESYMMEKGMSVFKSESKRFSEIETIPKAPGQELIVYNIYIVVLEHMSLIASLSLTEDYPISPS